MTHPEDLLTGYVDGTLSEQERAAVAAHLGTCDRCREDVELATRAVSALSALQEEPVPFGVTGPVLAEARRAAESRPPFWARMQWAVGLAAAAALVLVAVILFPQVTGDRDEEASAPRAAAPESGSDTVSGEAALGSVPALERLDADLDDSDIARLAREAAKLSAPPPDAGSTPEPPDDAVSCLVASGATIDDENALVRVIEASYLGTPAYLGVFHEGPGGGRPPETAVVWVVSSADCTILTLFSRAI